MYYGENLHGWQKNKENMNIIKTGIIVNTSHIVIIVKLTKLFIHSFILLLNHSYLKGGERPRDLII